MCVFEYVTLYKCVLYKGIVSEAKNSLDSLRKVAYLCKLF